jgi:hypothetical protein
MLTEAVTPARFQAASDDVRLCPRLVECDDHIGHATRMERLMPK